MKKPAKPTSSPLSRAAYKSGGAVRGNKGTTTVNIVMPGATPPQVPLAAKMPIPAAPGLAGGLPPVPMAPAPAGLPVPVPGGAKPMMKRGGGVMAGAGGGLGRLQKARGRNQ